MAPDGIVRVVVWHDNEVYMNQETENQILPENVPATARLLMDGIYLRLDDQVDVAKLRAHRRRQRSKKHAGNNGKIVLDGEEEAGK